MEQIINETTGDLDNAYQMKGIEKKGDRKYDAYFKSTMFKGGLCYPLDIAEGKFYKEAISFQILQRDGISMKEYVADVIAPLVEQSKARINKARESNMVSELFDFSKLDKDLQAILKNTEEGKALMAVSKSGERPSKNLLDAIMYGAQKAFQGVGKHLQRQHPKDRFIGSVLLNMPASVQYNEKIDWESRDLGIVGGLMNNESGYGQLESGLLNKVGSMAGGAAGAILSKIFGTSGMAGSAIGAVIGSDSSIQSGFDSTFNIKANPFKEQTFQGVGFRPFEFSFTFRARSAAEMDAIQRIITVFRGFSKPAFKESTSGTFKYPYEFRIEFLRYTEPANTTNTRLGANFSEGLGKGNKDKGFNTKDMSYQRLETNSNIPEIKYCICTGVNTNYTGSGGWNSFKDGAPVDITLQLTFEETEIITREDVFGETELGDFKGQGRRF